MVFARVWAALIALLFAGSAGAASAASSAEVEIRVTDVVSHQPVRLARVLLVGGSTYAGYTDATGIAAFTGVEEGQYRAAVSHAGFTRIGSEAFDVTVGRRILIDVGLARSSGPKVIGRVQTRSLARLDSTTIGPRSPQERLSGGSLAQALGGLSEFAVRDGGVSLDGHDARDTEVSIDGVPSSAGGTGLDLRGLNLDLFSSASATSGSQTTAGATLALTTLEPTLAFQTSTTLAYGSDERANLRFWARGTAGRIGYVYGHASGGGDGPTDNLRYTDASGLDYLHRSGSSARGELFKARIPLSVATAFSGTFVTSRSRSDIVCERFVGPVPCGFGPGNEAARDASIAIGKLLFNGAASDGTLAVVRTLGDAGDDLSRRIVNGTPSPAAKTGRFISDALFGSVNLRGARSTTSVSIAAGRARFDQRISGAFSLAGGGRASNLGATVRREQQVNERLSAFTALSLTKDRIDKPLGASAGLAWRPSAADSFAGSASVRNGGATLISQGALRDPPSLVYDCPGHAVFATGLGDAATPSSVSDVRAAWQHRSGPWSLSGELGRQVQHGASVTTILNGEADQRDLDGPYLAAIDRFYATPAGCGTALDTPTPSNVYFIEPVSGIDRVYQTGRLGFSYQPSSALAIGGYARFADARALGNDPRLTNPFSVTVPGKQLPNVARWRAGLVLDYKPKPKAAELLALYQYVGTNNERNLPAFGTLAVGASFDTQRGNVTLGITNLTDTHAGTFVTAAGAVPLQTAGGTALPSLAQPLRPRSFNLSYTVRTGAPQKAQTGDVSRLDAESPGPTVRFGPLPEQAPAKPFALDRTDANCTPEHVEGTTALLNSLRAAAEQLDAVKARTGTYPPTYEAGALEGFDGTLVYHKTGGSYAFQIVPRAKNVIGLACVALNTAGDPAHTSAAGAYSDAAVPRGLEFEYMPRFGIYVVFHQGTLVENVGAPAGTADRPADPFTIREQCPTSQRPLVSDAIAQIRLLSGGGEARTLESGVRLVRGRTRARGWWRSAFLIPCRERFSAGAYTYARSRRSNALSSACRTRAASCTTLLGWGSPSPPEDRKTRLRRAGTIRKTAPRRSHQRITTTLRQAPSVQPKCGLPELSPSHPGAPMPRRCTRGRAARSSACRTPDGCA